MLLHNKKESIQEDIKIPNTSVPKKQLYHT